MNNIKAILKSKNISIRKLSNGLNMCYSATYKMVNKESLNTTQFGTVIRVAEFLGVSIEELYK